MPHKRAVSRRKSESRYLYRVTALLRYMGEKTALCGVVGREAGYREQHDVLVTGIVVHRRVKLPPLTTGERVPERWVAPHPLAQFDDA